MILCDDDSLYTGITTDMTKRLNAHTSQRGAKYFRARTPLRLMYLESGHNRSTASKREAVIKKLSRLKKIELLDSEFNQANNFLLNE